MLNAYLFSCRDHVRVTVTAMQEPLFGDRPAEEAWCREQGMIAEKALIHAYDLSEHEPPDYVAAAIARIYGDMALRLCREACDFAWLALSRFHSWRLQQ